MEVGPQDVPDGARALEGTVRVAEKPGPAHVYLIAGDRAVGADQRATAAELALDGRDGPVGRKMGLDGQQSGAGYLFG